MHGQPEVFGSLFFLGGLFALLGKSRRAARRRRQGVRMRDRGDDDDAAVVAELSDYLWRSQKFLTQGQAETESFDVAAKTTAARTSLEDRRFAFRGEPRAGVDHLEL
jgi:hypothetical protein